MLTARRTSLLPHKVFASLLFSLCSKIRSSVGRSNSGGKCFSGSSPLPGGAAGFESDREVVSCEIDSKEDLKASRERSKLSARDFIYHISGNAMRDRKDCTFLIVSLASISS